MAVENADEGIKVQIPSPFEQGHFIGHEDTEHGPKFCRVATGPQTLWKVKYLNIDIVVFYHETCTGGYHWSREIDEVILQQHSDSSWEHHHKNHFHLHDVDANVSIECDKGVSKYITQRKKYLRCIKSGDIHALLFLVDSCDDNPIFTIHSSSK